MQQIIYYIGIDISSETFTASCYQQDQCASSALEYSNNLQGFETLECWFTQQGITAKDSIVCMESTGVYCEELCYYFHHKGYRIVVEAPQKTKRAFQSEDKSDFIDAQQLGEYAFRYFDKLSLWEPRTQLVEHVGVLLTTREQLVKQKTMNRNLLKTLQRKVNQTPLALEILKQLIEELKQQIQTIEQEISLLFEQDPLSNQAIQHLKKIKGVGLLLAANLFVFTQGFQKPLLSNHIAARLGIAPRVHSSGSSVRRKTKSRGEGHRRIRKLLYLAAMSVRRHDPKFEHYFNRKIAEGKEPTLVLNNIQNKMIRIMSAIINSNSPYFSGFQSVNPALLKNAA